ncbi:MAG: glutamyl-tRNA reductase [bacterium]|nr:MAG: glutamyl-tRNA reductase [bacterium]
MHLFNFGINHKTAPLELREQTAFAPDSLVIALADITDAGGAREATILSTCNRTEIYCSHEQANENSLVEWFCDYHRLNADDIEPYLYRNPGDEAVRHAFRVASGLDSMVLGEPQILGQMKEAFATAHKTGVTGKLLNQLFQHTFSVAKQVRTDTQIGASAVSVAYAAVKLAKQIFTELSQKTVLLIGAGETIELTAQHLSQQQVGHIIVSNRTVERAQKLAELVGGEAIALAELPTRLHDADIVISSTASQLPILGKGAVEQALKKRRHRPIFMVDLAVPRDIEAEVSELSDVFLYTVDDLQNVIDENLQSRREAAEEAEKIIDLQVVNFVDWLKSLDAVPMIRALRENADQLRQAELEKALKLLASGENPKAVMESLARSLTNKYTHNPTAALKKAGLDADKAVIEAARRLFDLKV